ncbi:MAG: site-specific integrase [Planctomycetes bacterium]|nr:site-specific integrase [Planctomycetota bacterium]
MNKAGTRIILRDELWTIRVFENGRRKDIGTGTADRKTAEAIAAKLALDAIHRKRGIVNAAEERQAKAAEWTIREHLRGVSGRGGIEGFADYLRERQGDARHVEDTLKRVERIIDEGPILSLAEFRADRVVRTINRMKAKCGRGSQWLRSESMSVETRNSYIRAAKSFARWLWRQHRTPEHQLLEVDLSTNEADRRRRRRVPDVAELPWILKAAAEGPAIKKVSGEARELYYRLAVGTGLRASELNALDPARMVLDGAEPEIIATATKNGLQARQPITEDLAKRLRVWLAKKRPLPSLRSDKTSVIFRADVAAARELWLKDAKSQAERRKREESDFLQVANKRGERIDFHSLRAFYITEAAIASRDPKTFQTLARHSSAAFSLAVYAKARNTHLRDAIKAMPAF